VHPLEQNHSTRRFQRARQHSMSTKSNEAKNLAVTEKNLPYLFQRVRQRQTRLNCGLEKDNPSKPLTPNKNPAHNAHLMVKRVSGKFMRFVT